MMRELEVTLRLRNNLLKERRIDMGMDQRAFARAVGMSLAVYRELEALRRSPKRRDGEWKDAALILARFHCVEPEDLWPAAVLAVETPVQTRKLDGADIYQLFSEHQERLILSAPDEDAERSEIRDRVIRALSTLTEREARILRARFGFDDGVERTLREIGDEEEVSQERIREIEDKALRKLGRPSGKLGDL